MKTTHVVIAGLADMHVLDHNNVQTTEPHAEPHQTRSRGTSSQRGKSELRSDDRSRVGTPNPSTTPSRMTTSQPALRAAFNFGNTSSVSSTRSAADAGANNTTARSAQPASIAVAA
nr:hypothetical protein CFP56_58133 [Quercus suber]